MVGQDVVVERLLVALFTGGHLLLQGVPGLAKTLLVAVLSKTIDLHFARIQFTVDLLPSDIIGSEILDQRTNEFRVHKGPIFTNLLLGRRDQPRAPKVQSAMLEAMQERRVTIGNETFKLPAPFLVIATQNPIEQSGTFELPEAQLDRFMLCHRLDYPEQAEEKEILRRNASLGIRREDRGAVARTEFDVLEGGPVATTEELVRAMEAVHNVYVERHIHRPCRRDRRSHAKPPPHRAGSQPAGRHRADERLARSGALIHGRNYVIPEDLFALAEDVILHRIRLTYEALADGLTGACSCEILGPYGGTLGPVCESRRRPAHEWQAPLSGSSCAEQ